MMNAKPRLPRRHRRLGPKEEGSRCRSRRPAARGKRLEEVKDAIAHSYLPRRPLPATPSRPPSRSHPLPSYDLCLLTMRCVPLVPKGGCCFFPVYLFPSPSVVLNGRHCFFFCGLFFFLFLLHFCQPPGFESQEEKKEKEKENRLHLQTEKAPNMTRSAESVTLQTRNREQTKSRRQEFEER